MRNKFVVKFAITIVLAFGALSQGQDVPPREQNDSKVTDESQIDNQPSVSDGVLAAEVPAVPAEAVVPVEQISPVEPVSDGAVEVVTASSSSALIAAPTCGGCAPTVPICAGCVSNCRVNTGCNCHPIRRSAQGCHHAQGVVSLGASSSRQLSCGTHSIGLVGYHQPVQEAVTVPTTVSTESNSVMFATGNPAVFEEFSGMPTYSAPPVPSCEPCCDSSSRVRVGARRSAAGCPTDCSSCDAGSRARVRGLILRRR